MKYGTVDEHLLGGIDFRLPPDPAVNFRVLNGKRLSQPKIFVGSGNWGHISWVGTVYPPKTPANRYRQLFPAHFHAMELNATHYKIYPDSVIREWAAPARGKEFKFCPKFPQSISHYSSFTRIEAQTDAFIQSIAAFEELLGPCFLQVPDRFTPAMQEPLFHYLSGLPKDLDVFLEVRHPDWFLDGGRALEPLQALGRGVVITDTPGRRDGVHMLLTVPRVFLRFVSNGNHPTTFERINAWAVRIGQWIDQGLAEAYIMVHPGDEAVIPGLTMVWIEALHKTTGIRLRPPFTPQATLF